MKSKDLIKVKEIPEFIEVSIKGEKKKFRNIPVSGVVAEFPAFEHRHFGGEIYAPFIRLMDPRGFHIDIDYNDFIDLIKHASINNGVIDSEIRYSIIDHSGHFFICDLPMHGTGLVPITKSMEVIETVSSGKDLVPGNRYHIKDYGRPYGCASRTIGNDKELVYIGKTTIPNNITSDNVYTFEVDLWVDPDTMEILAFRYNNDFDTLCWTVDKQHPADLDLLRAAQDRLIGSVFENDGRNVVKIEINPGVTICPKEDFDIKAFTTMPECIVDVDKRTAFFVKKHNSGVIEILQLFASVSCRNTWAEVKGYTYEVVDGRVKITYDHYTSLGKKREILKYYKDSIKTSSYDYINFDDKELLDLCETVKNPKPIINCTYVDGCSFNLGLTTWELYNRGEGIKLKMRDI